MTNTMYSGVHYLILTGKIEEDGVKEMGMFASLSISIQEVSMKKR